MPSLTYNRLSYELDDVFLRILVCAKPLSLVPFLYQVTLVAGDPEEEQFRVNERWSVYWRVIGCAMEIAGISSVYKTERMYIHYQRNE